MNFADPVHADQTETHLLQQTQSEAKLHASELRYRRLFESAMDGILILNAETGMVVDVNPFLVDRLGLSREEILGRAIWELGPFKDIVGNIANFAELQQNNYIRYEDKPLETANGKRFDVEFISNVYFVEGEKVIQCNIRDITARKAAERQLSEQHEILSHSHEGVIIESLANQISLWNSGAAIILGWTAEEATGRASDELLGMSDPALLATVRASVEQAGFWHGELRAQARDGRKLVLDCRVTLARDKAGRPRARLTFFADITEKKKLEEQLLRVQRIEALGTLSGGIAHDLNNILTPILMAAGMLRDRLGDSRDRDLASLIEHSAQRGAAIIRQLLTFSRGIDGERVSVQLRHLVSEMAGIARETFPRNLTWIDAVAPDLWPIVADATQLHQVLMNLCVNARDAMPGGGTLTVSAKNVQLEKHDAQFGAHALNGPYILLTVRDTGQGISPAAMDRIFDPFFTTKPIGKGTGLGLSTVLGIVRSHGGFVTVYSEPGHGAAFHVYLPAAPGAVTSSSVPVAPDLTDGAGETILVVDDEASIVMAVRRCLERHGYRVLTAANGQDAMDLLAVNAAEVKIVFTDVMMPVMDGRALAKELHRLYPHVRVIASSGLDLAGRPAEVAAGLIAEFLEKPYQSPALLAAIRRQLKSDGPSSA